MHPAFRRWPRRGQHTALAVVVTAVAFLLAILGLASRTGDSLAILWPANALLAALLLRYPALAIPSARAGILSGLTLANILWGEPLSLALSHGLADLSGTLVAWHILAPFGAPEDLRTPRAIARLLSAGIVAAATNAAIALTLLPHGAGWAPTAANWFFGQLLSYSAFLPPILLLPRRAAGTKAKPNGPAASPGRLASELPPIIALIGSLALCVLIGGPGAVIFPVPALLYAALILRPWATAWLASATAVIVTLGIAHGWIPVGAEALLAQGRPWDFASLRLGVLLLVGAPLLVSGVLAARSDTIEAQRRALDHDALTKTLSRQAFMRDAQNHLHGIQPGSKGCGLLVLDIDDFKRVNDTHGHPAGDRVLREFARTIREAARPHDLCGRMGGEEFALLLPEATRQDTVEIAERLRTRVAVAEILPARSGPLRITVSIGSIHVSQAPAAPLDALLAYADQAMYRAKHAGGNRVRDYETEAEPPSEALPRPSAAPPHPHNKAQEAP